jgi:hypothetical protein
LASVLAFAASYAAAEDVKPQADYGAGAETQTQTQTFESSPAVSGSTSVEQVGDAAGGNVELMAAFERLRMLDEIGEVTVVKLQPGEQLPESADLESDKMTGAETSDTADAAAEIESDAADSESDKMTSAEAGAAVDERIATGFEASGTEPSQAGAEGELTTGAQTATAEADVDSDTAPMTSADTSADVAAETELSTAEQVPDGGQPDAGALFGETDQPQVGAEAETSGEQQAAAGEQQPLEPSDAAGAVSATFIEDTVNQIPEIKQALEENDAEAADIVSIDIEENGEVTIFVRES